MIDDKNLKTVDVNGGHAADRQPARQTDQHHHFASKRATQYRMGKLAFRSSDPDQGLIFKSEILARAFPLKEGDVFDADKDPQIA